MGVIVWSVLTMLWCCRSWYNVGALCTRPSRDVRRGTPDILHLDLVLLEFQGVSRVVHGRVTLVRWHYCWVLATLADLPRIYEKQVDQGIPLSQRVCGCILSRSFTIFGEKHDTKTVRSGFGADVFLGHITFHRNYRGMLMPTDRCTL